MYVCGSTKSLTNIASPNAALETRDPDTNKLLGFLAKFDTLGQRIWSTYLGGDSTTDRYLDIKTTSHDTTGQENVFIYGRVRSTNLSTAGTFNPGYSGGLYDMVLLKYNESGQKQWGSYIGGSQDEFSFVPAHSGIFGFSNAMVVSKGYNKEEIQVAGGTRSADFYFDTDCSYTPPTGNKKGFIVALDYTGNLMWSRPFDEGINNINPIGPHVYFVSGHTAIDNLATAGAYKATKAAGSISGFVGKLNFSPCLQTEFTIYRIDNKLYAPNGFTNYQWFKNGLSIEGAITDSLDISDSEPAVFTVSFEGDCDCIYISSEYNTDPSSVHHPVSSNSPVTLYPNPADDYIHLSNLAKGVRISIYNQLGQKVCGHCVLKANKAIDISTLPKGFYILHLLSKEGAQSYLKFTKL